MEKERRMDIDKEIELTEISNSDIIESWDRQKYPSFQDYLESKEYKKWIDSK